MKKGGVVKMKRMFVLPLCMFFFGAKRVLPYNYFEWKVKSEN